MSGKDAGVKPWKTQRHLPEAEVTLWEIDTAGIVDSSGVPLPRLRRQVKGSKPKAVAHRRALLVELENGAGPAPKARQTRVAEGAKADLVEPGDQRGLVTLTRFIDETYSEKSKTMLGDQTHELRLAYLRIHVTLTLGNLPIAVVNTPDSISELRKYLDTTTMMNSTKNVMLKALSSVLKMAADPSHHAGKIAVLTHEVRIPYYPANGLKPGQVYYKKDGFEWGVTRHKRLSDELSLELYAACEDDYERVLLGLGFFGGCRASEMGARVFDDVSLKEERLHIYSTVHPKTGRVSPHIKNGIPGWAPVGAEFLEPLARLKRKAKSPYILGTVASGKALNRYAVAWRYYKIARRVGIASPWNVHALRHTFCCRMADAGHPPQVIQQLARHVDLKTTYGYMMPDERLLQAALVPLHL